MHKTLLFFFLINCAALASFAQTKSLSQLSLGGEYGLPVGYISSVYGSIYGASAKLEIPVSKAPLFLTFTTGISAYVVKLDYVYPANATVETNIPPLIYIPVEVGAKYYFSKIGYFEGDIGLSSNINGDAADKEGFIFAPIIGFSAPTTKHKAAIDICLRYESRIASAQYINQVALRVAYRFGI